MSAEQIRSILNIELIDLPGHFCDIEEAKEARSELEKKYKMSANEIFKWQTPADKAKARMGLQRAEWRQFVCLYFSKFTSVDGFDVYALEKELKAHQKNFERHLSKDWVYFLKLLIKLYKVVDGKKEQRPQGLLQVVK